MRMILFVACGLIAVILAACEWAAACRIRTTGSGGTA